MREALSAEDELCLCLVRRDLAPGVRRRALALLEAPLRWNLLLQRGREHQVLPLVYRTLRILEFPGVPPEPRAELTTAFRVNALRNEFLARELGRVLGLLAEEGLRVVPLKGIALAKSLYGDVAYRVCSDLDILVPAGEAPRARRLLLESGYTSPFSEEFFLKHQFHTNAECPLEPQEDFPPYLLELHWSVLQHSAQDEAAMQDLWSRAQPMEFLGGRAFALAPEWLFLHLVSHAAFHNWQVLKWLVDLHELCLTADMDWQQVREKAERFDLDLALGPTLEACSRLFDTPIPAPLSPRPLPAGVRLFPYSLDPHDLSMTPLLYARLLKRPSEKLQWLAEQLFIPRLADRWFFGLPPSLSFLYFFLRPLRLTVKWSWFFLRTGLHRLRQRIFSSSSR